MPDSSAMVSDPPDLRSDTWAGPQMAIVPPSTRSMRAWPDFTRTSLPLRSIVLTWPRTSSTLIGPCNAMASPSMVPTASPAGLSGTAAARTATSVAESSPLALSAALARFGFTVLDAAVSAATEFIFAAENAATPSKLAARKTARGRSATLLFASRDLLSDSNAFPILQFHRQFYRRFAGQFYGQSKGILSSRWLRSV